MAKRIGSTDDHQNDPADRAIEQVELVMQAKALTYMLEDLIESGDNNGEDPNAAHGLKQRQYACVRSLRIHLAEVEALSDAIASATIAKGKGDRHGWP